MLDRIFFGFDHAVGSVEEWLLDRIEHLEKLTAS
jgi:hypothetical protein